MVIIFNVYVQVFFLRSESMHYPWTILRLIILCLGWIDIGVHLAYNATVYEYYYNCQIDNVKVNTVCKIFIFIRLLRIINVLEAGINTVFKI